jgi:hypothetical protein
MGTYWHTHTQAGYNGHIMATTGGMRQGNTTSRGRGGGDSVESEKKRLVASKKNRLLYLISRLHRVLASWQACSMLCNVALLCLAASHPGGEVQVNVADYGAVGDGHTDDFSAFNAALQNVTSTGGTLFVPPGQFALSAPLVLTGNGISIVGAGSHPSTCVDRGSSLLSLTSNSTLVVFESCSSCALSGVLLSHASPGGMYEDKVQRLPIQATGSHHRSSRRARAIPACANRAHSTVVATAGAAITVRRSFATTLSNLWVERVWVGLSCSHMANTITLLDSFVLNILGPAGIQAAGGADGQRVDILQISRITTNNGAGQGELTAPSVASAV